jgi:hypothetical protein
LNYNYQLSNNNKIRNKITKIESICAKKPHLKKYHAKDRIVVVLQINMIIIYQLQAEAIIVVIQNHNQKLKIKIRRRKLKEQRRRIPLLNKYCKKRIRI